MNDINVLLAEDNEAEARHFELLLLSSEARNFKVTITQYLKSAYMALDAKCYDVVLLDLSLPDSPVGIHTLAEFTQKAPHIPTIVLTGSDDLNLAEQAMSLGAQDYVVKSEARGHILERAIVQGIVRKKTEMVRRNLVYQSLVNVQPTAEDARLTMVRPHIMAVTAYLNDVKAYLRDNAPEHYEALTLIEKERNLYVVLRELREVFSVKATPHSQTALSRATDNVAKSSRFTPVPPPENEVQAQAAILDLLKEYGGG